MERFLKINTFSNKVKTKTNDVKNAIFKKKTLDDIQYSDYIDIDIKKKKKHNLYGEFDSDKPRLRDYD